MRLILGCAAMMLVVAAAPAEDKTEKIDAKKLVGKWEPAGDGKGKVVIEFAKDGKLHVTEKDMKHDGTYTVDGNKITVAMTFVGMEQKHTVTVTKLTDAELTTKDEKGKEETLTRIKDK